MSNRAAWRLASTALENNEPVVLVTLAEVQGSAPREPGACLAVTADRFAGSIGGGRLEWQATADARTRQESTFNWQLDAITLNADIGQCCGGRVRVLFERLTQPDLLWLQSVLAANGRGSLTTECTETSRQKIWCSSLAPTSLTADERRITLWHAAQAGTCDLLLFGAGHVGLALAAQLAPLPVHVHHYDTRDLPEHPEVECITGPEDVFRHAPQNSLALVMTHDHALDYRITECALTSSKVRWVGLIGSASKRRHLERRLQRTLGVAETTRRLKRLSCPIGRPIVSRAPAEMAAIIAAELLYARDAVHLLEEHEPHVQLA